MECNGLISGNRVFISHSLCSYCYVLLWKSKVLFSIEKVSRLMVSGGGQYTSSHRRCSVRKSVLRNFAKFSGKRLYQSLFFEKETLAQVFSCEFCEISNKTFFTEHLRMTASVSGKLHIDNLTLEIDSTIGIISEKRHVRKMCQIVCWLAFIIYAKPCAK